jgi:hypothetical protein
MSLCIKKDNFNPDNIILGKEIKINNTIIKPLLYNYDVNIVNKFYFLTDWVHVSSYRISSNNIIFVIDDNDIYDIMKKLRSKLKFVIPPGKSIHTNMINNFDLSDSDDDGPQLKKKQPQPQSQPQPQPQPQSQPQPQPQSQPQPQPQPELQEKKYDITINTNNHNTEYNDYDNKINFCFTKQSIVTLYPSKKSGLEPYDLIKCENYKEIHRYFPFFNKQGNLKIVGKFLISVNTYISDYSHINYGLTFNIKSGQIKYEKSFIVDDKLITKSIFENKIKIEI